MTSNWALAWRVLWVTPTLLAAALYGFCVLLGWGPKEAERALRRLFTE